MTLDQIKQVERGAALLSARLSVILHPDIGHDLQTLHLWASEIRRFAVCFDDVDQAQAAGQLDQTRGAEQREEAITRLVQVFRPN